MLELIPWEWEEVLGSIFTFGAQKYAAHNWKKSLNTEDHDQLKEDRLGSAKRHILAYQKGEKLDLESGQPHLGHAAWNLLCVMWYDLNERKNS